MVKVAGYCRVSTDKDDQANSFESQQCYFREYISNHPDWELYEIYADEGITGTSTKKRTQFNRMINDAYNGRFHMIITKEVSRFSRNILDTISYTRELKAIGIGVIFATDRINTMESEAEMLLSFLASIAQEESRRTSSRVVWGQTRQMERGVVFGPSLLGYDVKNGKITINPEGAEIVRLIFHKYAVEHLAVTDIARHLACKGYHTYKGCAEWSASALIKILNNEKYVGDLVQKKTYTPDFLSHDKRINRGDVPLITIPNHHEPIVSREVWNMAQEQLKKNNKHRNGNCGHSNRYIFSGKIKCGECGASYVGRYKYRKDGSKVRRWSCGTAVNKGAKACDVGRLVRDDDAVQMLKTAIGCISMDWNSIINSITDLVMEAARVGRPDRKSEVQQLKREEAVIRKKKEAVLDSFFSQEITKDDMLAMNRKYDHQLEDLRHRLSCIRPCEDGQSDIDLRSAIIEEVAAIISIDVVNDVYCKAMLDSLTVFKDGRIALRLKNLPHVFWFDDR